MVKILHFFIVPTLCVGTSSGRSASINDRRAVKIRTHAEHGSDKISSGE
ncbi:MAG: hypothetical protein R6X11_09260 [Desulfonatronovibrio sp.]